MLPIKIKDVIIKQVYTVVGVNVNSSAKTYLRVHPDVGASTMMIPSQVSKVSFNIAIPSSFVSIWSAGAIDFLFEKYVSGVLTQTITKSYTQVQLKPLSGSSLGIVDSISLNLTKFDAIAIAVDTTSATISASTGDISMITQMI